MKEISSTNHPGKIVLHFFDLFGDFYRWFCGFPAHHGQAGMTHQVAESMHFGLSQNMEPWKPQNPKVQFRTCQNINGLFQKNIQ